MYDENCFEVGSAMPRGRFASDAAMCYEEKKPGNLGENSAGFTGNIRVFLGKSAILIRKMAIFSGKIYQENG